ncbi:MAG: hypothetical protein AB1505_27635, partial [Candidatus Latescibacterota bacterium]
MLVDETEGLGVEEALLLQLAGRGQALAQGVGHVCPDGLAAGGVGIAGGQGVVADPEVEATVGGDEDEGAVHHSVPKGPGRHGEQRAREHDGAGTATTR